MTDQTDAETSPPTGARARLDELVEQLRRRVNVQTGLERATTGATVAVMFSCVVLVLWKTHWIAFGDFALAAGMMALIPVVAFASAWLRERDPVALAQQLDRSHELHDRLSTALALVRTGRSDEFSAAQLRDALRHTDEVDVERAAPYRRPGDLPLFAAFLAAFAVLAILRPPSHAHPLPEPPRIKHDPVLDSATLAMEKDQIEEMKEKLEGTDDPKTRKLVDEIEELLEDVEKRRISGHEFLERLEKIEKKHFENKADGEAPEDSLSEALKKAAKKLEEEAGETLEKEEQLKKAAEALENEDLEKASKSLERLANELLDKENIDPERLERMAKLMEKFSDDLKMDDKKIRKMLEKHKDLVDKLSKKLENQGNLSQGEKRRLERAKKKSKDLQKKLDSDERARQKRQLKQLRRETKEAADKMKKAAKDENKKKGKQEGGEKKSERDGKDEGKKKSKYRRQAARRMKKSSKKMDEQAKKKQSREVRQAARKQLEELRRSMERSRPRQAEKSGGKGSSQSKNSGDKGEKMREFLRKAKGRSGKKGARRTKKGEGSSKTSKGKKSRRSPNKSSNKSQGSSQQKRANNSSQSNTPGDQPGGKALGEKEGESMESKRKKKRASGRKGGGPSRSKVIRSASEKGFATREYKEVYGDYSSVVEEVMKREDVPSGYRYYVKRYFELIKPRD